VADDFYVDLLVDADPAGTDPQRVFYVGKGRDGRALHHVLEYVETIRQAAPGTAAEVLVKASTGSVEHDSSPAVEHAKVTGIRQIVDTGREVRVDLLRDGLSSQMAHSIESAAIDVLDPATLTNLIAGYTVSLGQGLEPAPVET